MRHIVDLSTVPSWIRNHARRSYVLALYLGRPRDEEDAARVRAIYREAKRRRRMGEDVVVDHIVALNDPFACGLHHSANLRIVIRSENVRKSNGPEHDDLFGLTVDPYQPELFR